MYRCLNHSDWFVNQIKWLMKRFESSKQYFLQIWHCFCTDFENCFCFSVTTLFYYFRKFIQWMNPVDQLYLILKRLKAPVIIHCDCIEIINQYIIQDSLFVCSIKQIVSKSFSKCLHNIIHKHILSAVPFYALHLCFWNPLKVFMEKALHFPPFLDSSCGTSSLSTGFLMSSETPTRYTIIKE